MKKRLWSIVALSPLLLTAGCGEKPALGQQTAVQQAAPTKIEAAAPEPAAPVKTAAQGPDESVFQAKGNKNVIYSVPAKGAKIVALTFDDGPDGKYTARILDILKEQHVHATFFLIGQHAAKYPQIVKRIHEEGHAIGNHSWDHSDLSKLPEDQVREEIVRVDDVIKNITGEAPQLFRAPYGAISRDVLTDAVSTGHQIIGWSVDTQDWEGKSAAGIMATLKKEMRPGAIILQHSAGGKGGNLANTVEALPQIIAYLKKEGYSFLTVPDLISK
ncbi:polysaccharide deacetylase family protein [Paenibacillus sp. P26]|nr:polysaccharide deacetylase family protein [Paenibacillus sp. P26]